MLPTNNLYTDLLIHLYISHMPLNYSPFWYNLLPFRNSGVNPFGIWMNSSFKVCVKKATDEKILKDELTNLPNLH